MVDKDALIRMLPYFADPKVMCVTPAMKVYRPRGILQRIQSIEYDLGVFLRKAFSKINAIHVTPGPFSAYRKIFFKKHGGYDENNITEDMEVAMRIQSLNYRIENSPHSLVYTIAPNEFYPLLRQRRRWYFGMIRNLYAYKFMFGKKYGELGLFIFPMAIISTLMTMGVTTYYIIKAIVDNLKQLELYSLIGFDFLHNTRFEWYLFQYNLFRLLSDNIFIFGIFFLFITLSTLLLLNRKINSPDKPASTFISYACFMVFYGVLFTFWWIVSIIYSITKKEISW
jgi:cellulose synthase/poly-beta-1,6-N-acetylglucosamine synthase-like glycosyltransferase